MGIGLYARASAGPPSGFSYSGTLKNHGAAVGGAHDFAFDLVDGADNPVGCATDTRSGLVVTAGRFDVPDLFASCPGLDPTLAAQPALALRITVDGQVLSPNQPLGSVPWALRARTVDRSSVDVAPSNGSAPNGMRVVAAHVSSSGPTATNSSGDWIAALSRPTTGRYQFTPSPGVFGGISQPNSLCCTCSPEADDPGATCEVYYTGSVLLVFTYRNASHTNTANFYVICVGPQ